ncbi:lanthionine synthetase LanC family protein [Longimicrobium sp.]|uniref:lanthionine synthetase LanC family protein n=1 Tax=Longimicrobium sp. TaxID=2029185 RepID=UPI002E31CD59|nr:lanthionine synthetase LanC family protein [Longimicrobium sp.]HEX6039291.1 lanthionine synthetase LanC family protein [Longimicrobium sp.]
MDTQAASPEIFLNAALSIGRRIASQAQWDGDACTWTVMSPDRANPGARRAVAATASGTVYEGTAGMAMFLAELAALSGDEQLARAALGGVEFGLREGEAAADNSYGYHSGRVGIAYAAVRVGERLDRPELFARAEAVLRPLAGNETRDMGMDVIAGGGGGIPALLAIAHRVDHALAMGIARRLGDHLVSIASRDTEGLSWATMRSSSIRNLNGYAHGAAGIGHGLLELYAATGDGQYRYAAEQAFLYERHFFSAAESNWPDLRHTELGEYQFEGRMDELRDRQRSGNPLPPQPPRYMAAWCHGAPGIGFSRLRAYQLLGDPLYLEEARASFVNVEASIADELAMNYSLCHGRGGNAETLVEGARILGDPSIARPAQAIALSGIQRYENAGVPWPCGTMGGVTDPGLLLGESGIGMFLLRLARPDIPSVLFLTVPDESAAQAGHAGAEGFAQLRDRVVDEHFGRTLRLFRALGVDTDADVGLAPMGPAPRRSDAELAYDALLARVQAEPDAARRALLEDAFLVDRTRYELARAVTDYTTEFLDALARLPQEEVEWREGRVALSPRARIVVTRWDWDAWQDAGDTESAPDEDDAYYLVQFYAGRANVRRLSPFAALILQTVRDSATVDEVIDVVAEAVSGAEGSPNREWLEDRVVEQLTQAYRAGFVDFAPGLVGAGA